MITPRKVAAFILLTAFMGISAPPASAALNKVYVCKVQGLALRAGPGSIDYISKLDKGDKVLHVGTKNRWWRVKTKQGYVGFVKKANLTPTSRLIKDAIYKVSKTSALKVYAAPRTQSKALGTVKRGTAVQLKTVRNDWSYVKLENGNSGWVRHKFLQFLRA